MLLTRRLDMIEGHKYRFDDFSLVVTLWEVVYYVDGAGPIPASAIGTLPLD